jgi:VIT1/CCC1 family predicted Fe2+/Mn2+ transporter
MGKRTMKSWAARRLDPGSAMGEVLFGLIMTLTFTLGAGLVIDEEGRAGAREMLIGILGCNLAWGIIDGVLYVLGNVFERGRQRRLVLQAANAGTAEEGRALLAQEFNELLAPLVNDRERDQLCDRLLEGARTRSLPRNTVRREDLMGGLAAGWLVLACSFPAILPFILLDDPRLALRVSNGILISLLFAVGYTHAKQHTFAYPLVAGLVFALMGVFLVAIAIPLGG